MRPRGRCRLDLREAFWWKAGRCLAIVGQRLANPGQRLAAAGPWLATPGHCLATLNSVGMEWVARFGHYLGGRIVCGIAAG